MNTPEAWTERAKDPDPLAAVMWSPTGQLERFHAVISILNQQPGETLLDFGCGTGSLSRYVTSGYTGYDWSEGMIDRARKDHPEAEFIDKLGTGQYDLVACVGTFNLPGTHESTFTTLTTLWARARRALAVCLYAGEDPDCLIYQPSELLAYAEATAPLWSVTRYRPNDLLLVLHRN